MLQIGKRAVLLNIWLSFFASVAMAGASLGVSPEGVQQSNTIIIASSTSTQSSGLFDALLPQFKQATGIQAHVVAVGTGQAIRLASKGDADVLFVHHRASEDKFVADGYGVKRYDVMQNDYVLLGDKSLLLEAKKNDIKAMMLEIASKGLLFVSRGDESGTHKKERQLWALAGAKINHSGYRETGAGMGATLNTAIGMNAITLSDRGTWINFSNRADHVIIAEGSAELANPYGVILLNKDKFSHINSEAGQVFIDWLISAAGQSAIAAYKIKGQQLFFPTATRN